MIRHALSVTRSLKRKLLLPLLLIYAALAAVAAWAISAGFHNQLLGQVRMRAVMVANSVNYAAENVSRFSELQRIVGAIGAEEEINLIVVVGGQPAHVLAATRNAWLGKELTELPRKNLVDDLEEAIRSQRSHDHLHTEVAQFDFAAPLLLSEPELADGSLSNGAVMVQLDTRAIQAAMRPLAIKFSLIFLAALGILAAVGYGLIVSLVLRPISKIGELAVHTRDGADEGWAEVTTDDEIGVLARTLKDSRTHTDEAVHKLNEQANALRTAEARYRLLFEHSPDGVLLVEPDTGRILEFNEAIHRQLGYAREEFARFRISDIEAAETPTETAAHLAKMERDGRADFETLHRTRQGEIRNVHVRLQRVEVLGRPLLLGVCRDITARRRAEQETQRTAREWQATFDATNDAIWILDADHRVLRSNKTAEQYFSRPCCEMLGEQCWAIVHGTTGPHPDCPFVRARRSGHREAMELQDGERWFEVTVDPIRDAAGEHAGAVHIVSDITARKRADVELQRSYSLLAATLESTTDGILVVDGAGKVTSFNRRFVEMWQIPETLLATRDDALMLQFVVGQMLEPDAFLAKVEALYHAPQESSMDEIVFRDGRVFERYSQPQRIHDVIVGRVWSFRDVSARRHAEEALRESESRYRVLFEQSPDAVVIMDPETTLPIDFNDEACRQLGYSREEFARLRIVDYEADQSPAEIQGSVEKSMGSEPVSFEVRHRTKQGDLRNTWISVRALESGGKTVLYSIWHDITARKKAAEQLQRQAALLDAANESVCVRALDHTVTYWNAGAERLFGWTSAEALGRNAIEIAQSDAAAFTAAHAMLLEEGAWSGELKVATKAGKPAIVFCHWTLLRDEQQRPKEVLAISIDVTDKKQMEAHLRRAERMDALGTLAGGIAHDFNNIIGAIIGNVELAQQDVGAGHPASESLNEIRKASRRARDLVLRILAFGRQHQQPHSVIALHPVLEEAIDLLRAMIPPGVDLVATFDSEAPMVLADSTQIHEVLINLCTNAWQAMDEHVGHIEIQLDGVTVDAEAARVEPALRPGRFARLRVADSGSGIDAITLERIFEPFFTTKPVGEGTGLGLSAVHGIVKVHGGAITVSSQPGAGSIFTLYFPAAEVPTRDHVADTAEVRYEPEAQRLAGESKHL